MRNRSTRNRASYAWIGAAILLLALLAAPAHAEEWEACVDRVYKEFQETRSGTHAKLLAMAVERHPDVAEGIDLDNQLTTLRRREHAMQLEWMLQANPDKVRSDDTIMKMSGFHKHWSRGNERELKKARPVYVEVHTRRLEVKRQCRASGSWTKLQQIMHEEARTYPTYASIVSDAKTRNRKHTLDLRQCDLIRNPQ
jgi:hypothetical protein